MRIRVANIVSDDKFIDGIMEPMELLNDKWTLDYLLVANTKPESFEYIKNTEKVLFVSTDRFLKFLIEKQYDAIFVHCLASIPINIIPQIDKKIKVFWFAWGCDIYQYPTESPFLNYKLIKEETQKVLDKYKCPPPPLKKSIKDYLRPIKYFICGTPSERRLMVYYKAVKRVDFFSGVLDYEYDLMKSVKGFRAKRVVYKYVSPQSFSNLYDNNLSCGNNILIGNSAASTNNHLDIIPYLKKLNIAGRKIVLPLSYANTKEYVEDIANAYIKEFGANNLIILKDFIPYQEYSDIIQTCSIGIFFMERQQAMGNINMMLRNGCKVFLSKTNPVYNYYRGLGINLFSVQLDLNQSLIEMDLSIDVVRKNRDILQNLYSKERYVQDLNYIFECVTERR